MLAVPTDTTEQPGMGKAIGALLAEASDSLEARS